MFIRGPRQAGKTTLVQQISAKYYPATYVTLDDLTVLSAVTRDPVAFVKNIPKPVIVDEVHRVPDLLLAIKKDVDRNRVPGRYLLTGSVNVLTLPRVSDVLVGRMEGSVWLSRCLPHRRPLALSCCTVSCLRSVHV